MNSHIFVHAYESHVKSSHLDWTLHPQGQTSHHKATTKAKFDRFKQPAAAISIGRRKPESKSLFPHILIYYHLLFFTFSIFLMDLPQTKERNKRYTNEKNNNILTGLQLQGQTSRQKDSNKASNYLFKASATAISKEN